MTPQEACVQAFENGRKKGDAEGYARGKAEAFAEAGDLISRKALLEKQYNASRFKDPSMAEMVIDVRDVEDAPAVAAQPVKRGRWDYVGDPDEDSNVQAYCSACGAGDQHATSMLGKVSYCWHCGAKMDGDPHA